MRANAFLLVTELCISNHLSWHFLLVFYYANVVSLMRYRIIIFWGGNTNSNMIVKIQKRVFRLIYGKPFNLTCKNLFREYSLSTLVLFTCLKGRCTSLSIPEHFKDYDCHSMKIRSIDYE